MSLEQELRKQVATKAQKEDEYCRELRYMAKRAAEYFKNYCIGSARNGEHKCKTYAGTDSKITFANLLKAYHAVDIKKAQRYNVYYQGTAFDVAYKDVFLKYIKEELKEAGFARASAKYKAEKQSGTYKDKLGFKHYGTVTAYLIQLEASW